MTEAVTKYCVKRVYTEQYIGRPKKSASRGRLELVPKASNHLALCDYPEDAEELLEEAQKKLAGIEFHIVPVLQKMTERQDDEYIRRVMVRLRGLGIPTTTKGNHYLTTKQLCELIRSVQNRPIKELEKVET